MTCVWGGLIKPDSNIKFRQYREWLMCNKGHTYEVSGMCPINEKRVECPCCRKYAKKN
jgi:hypothetical protein